jgi:hypothetical protein
VPANIVRTFFLEGCSAERGGCNKGVLVTETHRGKTPRWVYNAEMPRVRKVFSPLVRPTETQVAKGRPFCWSACEARYRRRTKRHKSCTCVVCGGSFTTTRHDTSYCSNACRQRACRAAKSSLPDSSAPATT